MRTQPTPVLVQTLDCAHDHADRLARDLDLALDFARTHARAIARYIALALDPDRYIALALVHDRDRASYIALALARARALNFALASALASDLARDRDRDIARDIASALDEIYRALNDFTGADLRDADLRGVSLVRLRWSATTRWPPDWVEQIERDSVEVEPGVFEVRGGGTTYAPITV